MLRDLLRAGIWAERESAGESGTWRRWFAACFLQPLLMPRVSEPVCRQLVVLLQWQRVCQGQMGLYWAFPVELPTLCTAEQLGPKSCDKTLLFFLLGADTPHVYKLALML